jgi:hypothetical protein
MINYLIVVILMMLLALREKEIKASRLWILPAVFAYSILSGIGKAAITPVGILLCIVCLMIGLAAGAWRGQLMKVRIHPATGKITSKGSLASIVIFIVIMLIRQLAGMWGAHYSVLSLSTAILFIPLGNICASRYFLYLKVQRLQ